MEAPTPNAFHRAIVLLERDLASVATEPDRR
jgi:hypothetical protein